MATRSTTASSRLALALVAFVLLTGARPAGSLPDYGAAPELRGLAGWINSPPLTLTKLKGKVVLVKFWTFECVNCRHTLATTQAWYDRYHAQGFEIVAIHTPELPAERVPANVARAVRRERITYPVALDPDYATWDAYHNEYWPAEYLVDPAGRIRYVHVGEGDSERAEQVIQELLAEGNAADRPSAK
jgi:thiol-disulfide isomerase/thioredoxin